MPSVSIFGIGRMGGALAIALNNAGYRVDHLIHRASDTVERIAGALSPDTTITPYDSIPEITSDVILITTADPDIESAALQLKNSVSHAPVVLHASGSLSSDVLVSLARLGCSTGSLHPLVSISDAVSGAESFTDVYFCIEGDERSQIAAADLVRALGGRSFSIQPGRKPLYHAAAVTAAGHITALIDVAIEMLSECGIDPKKAQDVLFPLVKSTVANLETQTPSEALTGTFARADVAAFKRHLSAVEEVAPDDVREIYLLLAERSVELAERNGANAGALQKLREGISIAKRKLE